MCIENRWAVQRRIAVNAPLNRGELATVGIHGCFDARPFSFSLWEDRFSSAQIGRE